MPRKPYDYTGIINNNWKIISKDEKIKENKYWICECQLCGKRKSTNVYCVLNGASKSCGCKQKASIINSCSDKKIKELVNTSNSYSEILIKLGYSSCGGKSIQILKERIKNMNLDDKHLEKKSKRKALKNDEFCFINFKKFNICKKNGRDVIYYPEHPRSHSDGTVYVHIIQAENMLKRFLKPNEIVHHIDFNKNNNDINNLWVFGDNKDHCNYHAAIKNNLEYILKKEQGVYYCKLLEERRIICPICHQRKSKRAKICINCRKTFLKENNKRPNKERLKKEIIESNGIFVKVASNFNVSSGTIKKWCKYYGLPHSAISWRKIINN